MWNDVSQSEADYVLRSAITARRVQSKHGSCVCPVFTHSSHVLALPYDEPALCFNAWLSWSGLHERTSNWKRSKRWFSRSPCFDQSRVRKSVKTSQYALCVCVSIYLWNINGTWWYCLLWELWGIEKQTESFKSNISAPPQSLFTQRSLEK